MLAAGAALIGLGAEGGITSSHLVKSPVLSVQASRLSAGEKASLCTDTPLSRECLERRELEFL